jgi:hypothetical protein
MQLSIMQFTIKMFHIGFMLLKSQYYKIFKTLKLSYLQQNGLKSLRRCNSHAVSLCGGCIYSLYVDGTVGCIYSLYVDGTVGCIYGLYVDSNVGCIYSLYVDGTVGCIYSLYVDGTVGCIYSLYVDGTDSSCVWNTGVTWQGTDYKLPEDDTIVSKHVAVW